MKLCKDCKWYKKDWITHLIEGSDSFDKCLNPIVNENLVSGKTKGGFCDMLRAKRWQELDYSCGPEGKYWEAK